MKRGNQEIKEVKEEKEKPLRYKKLTGGLHYTADGRCIRKGETFECLPSKMSPALLGGFECLDKTPDAGDVGVKLEVKPVGKNKWDIVNSKTGTKLNKTPLVAAQAKNFLENDAKLPEFEEEDPEEEEFDD